jgi:hypothetical protein
MYRSDSDIEVAIGWFFSQVRTGCVKYLVKVVAMTMTSLTFRS